MSNAHASKQHGLTTMNTTRPKSNVHKREQKHKSVAKKRAIMEQRRLALLGKAAPVAPKKEAPVKAAPAVEKPAKSLAKASTTTEKPAKKPASPRKPRAKKATPAA